MQPHSNILSCEGLTKSYGKTQALKGINFTIDSAGVYAILGKNGAGKTTLIKCALGLEKQENGRLHIYQHEAGSMAAKQRIGVILQDSDLPDLLTIREQLSLFSSYYPSPLDVEFVIEMCDLSGFVDRRYKHLSGGQKRLSQFALAVVGDPDLIFLDEPTTGLDVDARRTLWNVIRDFAQKGKTIVLTTHYLEEAENLADNIMVMANGTIVANASPEELQRQTQGSVIRCQTTLSNDVLSPLPGVCDVSSSGRFTVVTTNNATLTLTALLRMDPDIIDLTVSQPKLEDVFNQLNQQGVAS